MRSAAECRRAVERVIAQRGKIDILCNCAGVAIRKDIVELTEDEWDFALDVTLKGIYLLSREVVPHMIRNGGGSIINIGSGWSLKGGPRAASYCAAKGGAVNLTRAMAIDHGKNNIRVNCVCPGDVDTPMLRERMRATGRGRAGVHARGRQSSAGARRHSGRYCQCSFVSGESDVELDHGRGVGGGRRGAGVEIAKCSAARRWGEALSSQQRGRSGRAASRCFVEHDAARDARIQRFDLRQVRDRDQFVGLRQHGAGQARAFAADENCRRPGRFA